MAVTVGVPGRSTGKVDFLISETKPRTGAAEVILRPRYGLINPDLTVGTDVTSAFALLANQSISFMGVIPSGTGFRLSREQMSTLGINADNLPPYVREYLVGNELTDNKSPGHIVDYFGLGEKEAMSLNQALFQYVINAVQTDRRAKSGSTADSRQYASNWWLFAKPRPEMRSALRDLDRYIATTETSKHRWFCFLSRSILPDQKIRVIASDDAVVLGVLSSKVHVCWANAAGGRQGVGNDFVYNNTTCFAPFPFPADPSESIKARLRAEAEALDVLRKRVLAEHGDLTLTKLYNVLEALRKSRSLTPQERDIHDRGLVTLIRQHHDAIDEGVADAYGWGDEHRAGSLDEETILTRLVALNKERAAEEARGLVRYLRPEFQDPGYRAPVTGTLDLDEAAVAPVSNVIPWPATLPEQVGAVQSILAAAPAPLGAADIARSFKGKRAATVRPVLDALAGLGMARRLNDGRYAA